MLISRGLISRGVTGREASFGKLPGIELSWSRRVNVTGTDGETYTWHVLDNQAEASAGTLLCVHGNPTWSYLWRRFLATAPPGWRVLAVDQLGMGFSDRPAAPRRLAERIADLNALSMTLGVTGPVVTLAHDWGGPISLGWALEHATQMAGIVLTNTAVTQPPGTEPSVLIRLARSTPLRELLCVRTPSFVRAASALSRPALPADIRRALAEPYRAADQRGAIADFVADIPLQPAHPSHRVLAGIADRLGELAAVPTMIVWGARDPVFSEVYLRDLLQRLPHADVHRHSRASHLVTEDVPETAEQAWRWIADRWTAKPRRIEGDIRPPWTALTDRAHDTGPAVVEVRGGERRAVSFAELEARVQRLAAGLYAGGVRPGQRVALLVPPGIGLTAALYACWWVGAVIVVADAGLGVRALGDALRSASPDHVIGVGQALLAARVLRVPGQRILVGPVSPPIRSVLGAHRTLEELVELGRHHAAVQPESDDAEAAVLFTSGATGAPKGVVYRLAALRAQIDLLAAACGITGQDRMVAAFAPFALYGPALGVTSAVPDVDVTKPGTLTAAALADAAEAIDATVVFASPAALRNVVTTESDLSPAQRDALAHVRLVLSAGAPVLVPLLRKVQQVLPAAELHTPYGMTEVLPVCDISLPELEAAGPGNGVCVGHPLPGVQIRVSPLDACGHAEGELTAEPEVTGEICIAAAHVKDRYDRLWATERLSSRTRGWHRSGDVGHLDAQGRLWVEGRLVHVIGTAYGPVTPVGREQRIEEFPGVRSAAIVGVGPSGTAQVVAVLELDDSADGVLAPPGMSAAVRSAIDVPVAAVLITDALPVDIRHASKIDRAKVARWAERVLAGGRAGRL